MVPRFPLLAFSRFFVFAHFDFNPLKEKHHQQQPPRICTMFNGFLSDSNPFLSTTEQVYGLPGTPLERYYEAKHAALARSRIAAAESRMRMYSQMDMQAQMVLQNSMMTAQMLGAGMPMFGHTDSTLRSLRTEIQSLKNQVQAAQQGNAQQEASRIQAMESRLQAMERDGDRRLRQLEEQALRMGVRIGSNAGQGGANGTQTTGNTGVAFGTGALATAATGQWTQGDALVVHNSAQNTGSVVGAPALPTTLAQIGALSMAEIQTLVMTHNTSFGIELGDSIEVCRAKLACAMMQAPQCATEWGDL